MISDVKDAIYKYKIIAIVRGVDASKCLNVARALYDGGIRLLEITYNQSDPSSFSTAADSVSALSEEFKGRMFIGSGTVTKPELVDLTAKAGGTFIVAPNTNVDVIHRAHDLGLVSIPGAMTPTEILYAYDNGADFVKLFPTTELGLPYLKAIRAPLSHVPLIVTSSITVENAKSYLDAGAVGLGVGGALANKIAIANEDYHALTIAAQELIASIS